MPLNFDAAMQASLPPSILTNSWGQMPASGEVTAGFPIPPILDFVGLTVYAAGVTSNSDYTGLVKNLSGAVPITIRR